MLSGKFEKSWSIKERVADILADTRNKGTFDSKSRKKGNTWTEIAFAGGAISSSFGLSTSCEAALCWHRQQVNTFQTSQVHEHSCFSMFWQFLQFFSVSISMKIAYFISQKRFNINSRAIYFSLALWLGCFFRSLSDVHCWHEVETLWHQPPHLADHQMHSDWFSKKTSD